MIGTDDAPREAEVLEGDEGEPRVGRGRDVGCALLETPLSELRHRAPVTVAPDAPVARALELMRGEGVSAVLVVAPETGAVVGIFTGHDLVSAPATRSPTPSSG